MFNDKYRLTQAVLEGIKTNTRRIIPLSHKMDFYDFGIDEKGKIYATFIDAEGRTEDVYPKYQVGEEVAIAQSYHTLNKLGYLAPEWLDHYCEGSAGYDNKMFVQAALMPNRIKITNIRVERLQDISDEDCMKEGIKLHKGRSLIENEKGVEFYTNSARLAFKYLINKLSGKHTWDSNPYVFVYDFELIK